MATWTTKIANTTAVAAAHVNLLQTLKADIDGQIAMTGVQQWKKGADVTPAATILTLGNDGNYFDVAAGDFASIVQPAVGGAFVQVGTIARLHFDDVCIITNSANIILPGGANITTRSGDEMEFICHVADQWTCINYQASYTGTWTPTRVGFTETMGGGTITNTGYYTKNGRLITVTATIVCAGGAKLSCDGVNTYLSGFPFTPAVSCSGTWGDITTVDEIGFAVMSTNKTLYVRTGWTARADHGYSITLTIWV